MAKRRNLGSTDDTETEEVAPVSAEERRRLRKRERAARDAGNKRVGGGSSWVRKGVIAAVPAGIIVVVVVLLLFNPFAPPCLQFSPIPQSSGSYPQFPLHNATDLSTSWCPPGVAMVFQAYPTLTIDIGSTSVPIPSGIGWNGSYTNGGQPYKCTLPLSTQPASQGGSPGTIYILSPWAYTYTLGNFFSVWQESYSSVNVNTTYTKQPINYTSGSLLGFSADASHAVTLWVDNHPSNAGPSLNLDTLTNQGSAYPSCLASIYGTGHTILLTYTSTKVAVSLVPMPAPTLDTAHAAPPPPSSALAGNPGPYYADGALPNGMITYLTEKGLGWLALKGDA